MPEETPQTHSVGYGKILPGSTWPDGSTVAVSLVLNIEDGAERQVARGHLVDDLNAHWVEHTVPPGARNLSLESAFEYGARAGIWRVLRALREYDAPCTAFCCAEALKANPLISAALVRDAHEIANHGLSWDTHTNLDAAAERDVIRASTAMITAETGHRPGCWYSRDGISPWTHANLLEEGYWYDSNSFCDDAPYFVRVNDRNLTVVPYAGDTNDSGLLKTFRTGEAFGEYLCDSLEMLLCDRRPGVSVLSVGLHPRLIGRPAFINGLRTFLREARNSGTWIATRAEIARYWSEHIAGVAETNVPHP